jgi:hypothetical protein
MCIRAGITSQIAKCNLLAPHLWALSHFWVYKFRVRGSLLRKFWKTFMGLGGRLVLSAKWGNQRVGSRVLDGTGATWLSDQVRVERNLLCWAWHPSLLAHTEGWPCWKSGWWVSGSCQHRVSISPDSGTSRFTRRHGNN